MSDSVTPELLRELLNETRELRRLMQTQTSHFEAAAFFLREMAGEDARNRFGALLKQRRRESGRVVRRVLPGQRPLGDWLASKGLELVHFQDDGLDAGPADEIAERLAADHPRLSEFLRSLVRAIALREGFAHGIGQLPAQHAEAVISFAQRLEDLGFVRAMNVAGGQIHVEPLLDTAIQRFFSGGWLERACINLVARLDPDRWRETRLLINAVARDPADLAVYEFDLVLPVAADELPEAPVAILDPKTGRLEASLEKLRRNVGRLGLPPSRYLIVRPGSDPAELGRWREALPAATVISFSHLRETLLRL